MKLNKKFILREILDDTVLVPVGSTEEKFKGLITTNSMGAYIWKRIEKSREQILADILSEYDIDEATAGTDLDEFLNKLAEAGIIDLSE